MLSTRTFQTQLSGAATLYTTPNDPAVILIIDGDPLTLTGIAATLDIAGYECHCARDAEAAGKAVRELRLDLIICDVQIDQQDGLELSRQLREAYGEELPVMFVSDEQGPDIVRRVHDAGGAYYLRKPFDPDALVELVGKALWMPHLVQARLEPGATSGAPRPASRSLRGSRAFSNRD